MEQKVIELLSEVFNDWQEAGWIPNWRIELGQETTRLVREKGWTLLAPLIHAKAVADGGFYSPRRWPSVTQK